MYWGFSRSGNPNPTSSSHGLLLLVPLLHRVCCTLQGLFPAPLPTKWGVLRCFRQVYLMPYKPARCALAEIVWESMKAGTSFCIGANIPLPPAPFVPVQLSACVELLKGHILSNFGGKRTSFEFVIYCFVFFCTQITLCSPATWPLLGTAVSFLYKGT